MLLFYVYTSQSASLRSFLSHPAHPYTRLHKKVGSYSCAWLFIFSSPTVHTRLFRFIVCRLAQACERGCSVAAASKRGGGRYDYGLDHGDGRLEAPWRGMY